MKSPNPISISHSLHYPYFRDSERRKIRRNNLERLKETEVQIDDEASDYILENSRVVSLQRNGREICNGEVFVFMPLVSRLTTKGYSSANRRLACRISCWPEKLDDRKDFQRSL